MIYGFENNRFYIDIASCKRPHGNMKEECDQRARELGSTGEKLLLGLSGGLDSQCILHSFNQQGIPLETVFFYMPGYNDNEYEQVKILDKKYSIKTQILDIDPIAVKEEIIETSKLLDIPGKNNVLQRKFLSMLPDGSNFIQNTHDPFVVVHPDYKNLTYFTGYYHPDIARHRAFESLNRKGKNIFYGDTPEYLASILDDDVFRGALMSARYFDENGAIVPNKNLKTYDRWDYYIKPIIYGRYWGDELIYFPKYAGFEKIEYLHGYNPLTKDAVMIPYNEVVNFLNKNDNSTQRYYYNIPKDREGLNNAITAITN